MNEQELRKLFTEIGCIMEDVSGTALVWHHDDSPSAADRAAKLRRACDEIGGLLDNIETKVRSVGRCRQSGIGASLVLSGRSFIRNFNGS